MHPFNEKASFLYGSTPNFYAQKNDLREKNSEKLLIFWGRFFFTGIAERLSYKEVAALKMPMRRVVNLRLKSPCIFWKEDSAEEMLLLRAYYKSSRWNLLKKMAYEGGFSYAA